MNIHRTACWCETAEETEVTTPTHSQWVDRGMTRSLVLSSPNEKRDGNQTVKVFSSEVRITDGMFKFCVLTRMSE